MTSQWQPQTAYGYGSKVIYNGETYEIIQPHTSLPGWEPTNTPALWVRRPGGGSGKNEGYQQQQPSMGQVNTGYGNQGSAPAHSEYGGNDQKYGNQQQQEPQVQEQKNKVQEFFSNPAVIAGGVLGAAALLGSGAFAIHKFNQNHNDDQKRGQWVSAVMAEEQQARQSGARVFWTLTQGTNIPSNAIQCGNDTDGSPLYAARIYHADGVHVGKAGHGGCYISYGGKEIHVDRNDKYQVLCGDASAVKWVEVHGRVNRGAIGGGHVLEAGNESDQEILFISRVPYQQGSVQVGKSSAAIDGVNFPYGGKEVTVRTHQVAVIA